MDRLIGKQQKQKHESNKSEERRTICPVVAVPIFTSNVYAATQIHQKYNNSQLLAYNARKDGV